MEYYDLGAYIRAITTKSPDTQLWFDRGLNWLFGFNHAEAIKCFGKALETEQGPITVEGHSDSDKISSLAFPDNMALSGARANAVAQIISGELSDPGRIEAKAFGDTQPIGSNDSTEGKALNRRVEFVIPRQN